MKKIIIIIVAVLVAVALGIIFYLRSHNLKDFEPQIKAKLSKLVKDASNGLYDLEIEKLEINVLSSEITLINTRLRADSLVYARMEKLKQAPNDIFDVSISQIALDNIDAKDFLNAREINLRRLFINKPVIKVTHKKQAYNNPADSSITVYQKIKKDISGVKIDSVILENIDFIHINKNRNNKQTRLSNVKLFFNDILIDSSTQFDQERFLFARNCLISIKDYNNTTKDNLYRFSLGDIQINTSKQLMNISGIRFEPALSEKRFYQRIRRQQDRFELSVQEMNFSKVNWWAILAEESFISESITMSRGNIKVYNDKSQPVDTRSKLGKYPHQLLMQLPFTLKIDALQINDFDVSYTELNPKSGRKGTLYFNNVNGKATNIINDPEQIKINPFITLTANASFLKEAPLKAVFTFDLANHKKGNFTVKATMGTLSHTAINTITVPLALLKLNSLAVKSLQVDMRGDNNIGRGTVTLMYADLNVTALKNDDDELKKRGLLSFVANSFIIKKANPSGGRAVRVEKAEFKRDPNKSFFNLIWKTIFTGASQTVGYNKK